MIRHLDGYAGAGGVCPHIAREGKTEFTEETALETVSDLAYVKEGIISLEEWKANALRAMEQVGPEAFFDAMMDNVDRLLKVRDSAGFSLDVRAWMKEAIKQCLVQDRKKGVSNESLLDDWTNILKERDLI